MAWSTFLGYARPIRWGVRQALERGAACVGAKTAATCRMLLEGEEHLWTFLRVPGIEPTNNAAERALRHAVSVAQIERRDGERVGQPVRRAGAERDGDLPPAGPERAGVPDRLLPGPGREGCDAYPARPSRGRPDALTRSGAGLSPRSPRRRSVSISPAAGPRPSQALDRSRLALTVRKGKVIFETDLSKGLAGSAAGWHLSWALGHPGGAISDARNDGRERPHGSGVEKNAHSSHKRAHDLPRSDGRPNTRSRRPGCRRADSGTARISLAPRSVRVQAEGRRRAGLRHAASRPRPRSSGVRRSRISCVIGS